MVIVNFKKMKKLILTWKSTSIFLKGWNGLLRKGYTEYVSQETSSPLMKNKFLNLRIKDCGFQLMVTYGVLKALMLIVK